MSVYSDFCASLEVIGRKKERGAGLLFLSNCYAGYFCAIHSCSSVTKGYSEEGPAPNSQLRCGHANSFITP